MHLHLWIHLSAYGSVAWVLSFMTSSTQQAYPDFFLHIQLFFLLAFWSEIECSEVSEHEVLYNVHFKACIHIEFSFFFHTRKVCCCTKTFKLAICVMFFLSLSFNTCVGGIYICVTAKKQIQYLYIHTAL